MMLDNDLRGHIEELASGRSSGYCLLLALEDNPNAEETSFQSLSRLVDRVTFYEISVGEDVRGELTSFLKSTKGDLASIVSAWSLAFSAAEPSRYGMKLVLSRYPAWIRGVSERGNEAFRMVLPMLA